MSIILISFLYYIVLSGSSVVFKSLLFTIVSYKYGFNGKENDNEVKGEGNQQDYGMRIYDPRLGRFLSVDPISNEYPELTPYQFASNSPILGIDKDGLEFYNPYELAKQKIGQTLTKVLSFTDVNDATVLVTMATRGSKAINVDGTIASNTDRGFAILGANNLQRALQVQNHLEKQKKPTVFQEASNLIKRLKLIPLKVKI
jgi:RHS repeat-associated protein